MYYKHRFFACVLCLKEPNVYYSPAKGQIYEFHVCFTQSIASLGGNRTVINASF